VGIEEQKEKRLAKRKREKEFSSGDVGVEEKWYIIMVKKNFREREE